MEKSTKIIIVHLVAQIVIGIVVFAAASQEYESAQFGGLGIGIAYFLAAIISITTSLAIMTKVQKQPLTVLLIATILSICLWVFGPPLIDKASNLIPHTSIDAIYEKSIKKPTLEAVKEMGFLEYSWDTQSRTCLLKLPSGKQHRIILNGDYLKIYADVKQPIVTDTLGWMRTLLLEALVYLKPKTCLFLNSCINNKDFDFVHTISINRISLQLGPPEPYDPVENLINGECLIYEYNKENTGELCISIYYSNQIHKKR
jgi:hypothetical protein